MAKRGRKPSLEKKGFYFQEIEEQAVADYLNCENEVEKNRIFKEVLQPALYKMVESIIRRYKLYPPQDENFDETFNDTLSFLMTKINRFNPNSGYKAYSYCGTVCKNYLMFKSSQYQKKKQRNLSYETMVEELSNNYRYAVEDYDQSRIAEKLVSKMAIEIDDMMSGSGKDNLNENEVKVGKALVSLLSNWEELLPDGGSNKLQKSSVLYYLREETMMTTKEVRDNMKKFKNVYKLIKKACLED
jgi:ribosomal protein S20